MANPLAWAAQAMPEEVRQKPPSDGDVHVEGSGPVVVVGMIKRKVAGGGVAGRDSGERISSLSSLWS